jgi:hypothetical protein
VLACCLPGSSGGDAGWLVIELASAGGHRGHAVSADSVAVSAVRDGILDHDGVLSEGDLVLAAGALCQGWRTDRMVGFLDWRVSSACRLVRRGGAGAVDCHAEGGGATGVHRGVVALAGRGDLRAGLGDRGVPGARDVLSCAGETLGWLRWAQRRLSCMSGPSLPLQGLIVLRRSGAMATAVPGLHDDVIAVVGPRSYTLPPKVPKLRAENDQMESFAKALALAEGIEREQITWVPGKDQDAPDITMTLGEGRPEIEIEFTTLTAGPLRDERRRLADVAERVRDAIARQAELGALLVGRTVDLSDAIVARMPERSGASRTAARIIRFLAVLASPDAAEAAEGRDDAGNAAYSRDVIDGIRVRLFSEGIPGVRVVARAAQASITLSEARGRVCDRLRDKNLKMREYVVVCAGDPDRDGLVLPLDVAEFELLAAFGCGDPPPTPYVKRAWLHLTGTNELIPLVCQASRRRLGN